MDTQVLLYALPGLPLQVEDLMPQPLLARCAGALRAQGHQATIIDDGTVDAFAAVGNADLSQSLVSALDELPPTDSRWSRLFSATRRHQVHALLTCEERRIERAITTAAERSVDPDIVVLQVQHRKDIRVTGRLAQELKSRWPRLCVVVTGKMAARYGRPIMETCPGVDAACVALPESCIPSLAAHWQEPETWCQIPGLLSRNSRQLHEVPTTTSTGIPTSTLPAYHPNAYPALLDGGKFRLFTLKQTWGRSHIGHYRAGMAGGLQLKSLRQLRREMIELHELYGAQAFHISGSHTPADAVIDFARECISLPFPVAYSRDAHVLEITAAAIPALVASGCHALGFSLLTGSQMALSDYFGENWSVSHAIACLRACRNAGLHLHADFIHPVPADDFHSRAETIRLLHRCRPHSLRLLLPALVHGSAWHQHASEFEFSTTTKRTNAWIDSEVLAMDTQHEASMLPYSLSSRHGTSIKQIHETFTSEVADLGTPLESGCRSGLIARLSGAQMPEGLFTSSLERAVKTLDLDTLHSVVNTFNIHATASINTIDFYPSSEAKRAVGN